MTSPNTELGTQWDKSFWGVGGGFNLGLVFKTYSWIKIVLVLSYLDATTSFLKGKNLSTKSGFGFYVIYST